MAVDDSRYQSFRQRMNRLTRDLSAEEQAEVIRAKVLDYLARTGLTKTAADNIRGFTRTLVAQEMESYVDQAFDRAFKAIDSVNRIYSDLGDDITRNFPAIYAAEQALAQSFGDYEEDVAIKIQKAVRKAVTDGQSVDDLEKAISGISEKTAFYAEAIAKTQVRVVSRVAKVEKARIAEVFYYQYVGNVRGVTRAFCRTMAGTTHHVDTIRQLRNGNKEPVLTNCGGWQCVHDWEPDPFATESDEAELVTIPEGTRTVVLAGGEGTAVAYQENKRAAARAASR